MLYVDIILPIPIKNTFTYHFPKSLVDYMDPGMRVTVPFGKTKIQTGIVLRVHENQPAYDTKEVDQILDETPVINKSQLRHWIWLAEYYMCSIGEVVRAALPSAFLLESETLISLRKMADDAEEDLTDDEYLIVAALHKQSALRVQEVQAILQKKNVVKLIQSLLAKEVISVEEEVFEQYVPKRISYVRLAKEYESEEQLNALLDELSKGATKQRELLMNLFMLQAQTKKPIEPKQLIKSANTSNSVLKALIDKNAIEKYVLEEDRHNFEGETIARYELSDAQEEAYESISAVFKEKTVCLLHGITSSGKTEVYVKCIEDAMREGK